MWLQNLFPVWITINIIASDWGVNLDLLIISEEKWKRFMSETPHQTSWNHSPTTFIFSHAEKRSSWSPISHLIVAFTFAGSAPPFNIRFGFSHFSCAKQFSRLLSQKDTFIATWRKPQPFNYQAISFLEGSKWPATGGLLASHKVYK